jgi:senataxin
MGRESPKKILLCAPSNAAIDEVAHRIKESRSGPPIKVVRLGNDKSINISVKDISLDYLVEQKMNANQDQNGASMETGNETTAVRTEIEVVKRMKQQKLEELSTIHDNLARSRKIRAEVLYEADVICSTLSGAGHETVEPFDFEMVIIDEAAQAIELSSLIPLKFRCKCCIMVGGMLKVCKDFLPNFILSLDPQQLPPTVLSQEVSLCCSPCLRPVS